MNMGFASAGLFGVLAAVASFAHAENSPSLKLMEEMQGVYKQRFTNGDVAGSQKWVAENIVEIVLFDDSHIYFRLNQEGGNGHICMLYGIAAYEERSFVFRDSTNSTAASQQCTLKISLSEATLKLTDLVEPHGPYGDTSSCSQYCGARVNLNEFTLKRSSKRKIRYLDVIKASSQYQQAVQGFKAASTNEQK